MFVNGNCMASVYTPVAMGLIKISGVYQYFCPYSVYTCLMSKPMSKQEKLTLKGISLKGTHPDLVDIR